MLRRKLVPVAVTRKDPRLHFQVWVDFGITSVPVILQVPNGRPLNVPQIFVPCVGHGFVIFMFTL